MPTRKLAPKPARSSRKPAAKPAAKPARAAPAAAARVADAHPAAPFADDGGALIRSYLAATPANPASLTARLARQCSAAHADALGARTRAPNVLHESERMARTIHATLAGPALGALAYSRARFRYVLELTTALRAAIASDVAAQRATGAVQTDTAATHDAALRARDTLLERLEACARGEPSREDALARSRGDTKDDDAVIESLAGLIVLAKAWRGTEHSDDRELADASSLDEASIVQATAARTALVDAHRTAGGTPPRVVRDSPATNRIEGQLLAELRVAIDQFAGAHARDARVPRLVPGAGTRQALGHHHDVVPTPAPGAGATATAATTDGTTHA